MDWRGIAAGLIPSIGVALVFWFVLRAVIRADRNERSALAEEEQRGAEHDGEEPPSSPA